MNCNDFPFVEYIMYFSLNVNFEMPFWCQPFDQNSYVIIVRITGGFQGYASKAGSKLKKVKQEFLQLEFLLHQFAFQLFCHGLSNQGKSHTKILKTRKKILEIETSKQQDSQSQNLQLRHQPSLMQVQTQLRLCIGRCHLLGTIM